MKRFIEAVVIVALTGASVRTEEPFSEAMARSRKMSDSGDVAGSQKVLEELHDRCRRDRALVLEAKYELAVRVAESGKAEEAIELLQAILEYREEPAVVGKIYMKIEDLSGGEESSQSSNSRRLVEREMVRMDLHDSTVSKALAALRRETKQPVVLDIQSAELGGRPVSLTGEMTSKDALEKIREAAGGSLFYRYGVVVLVTPERAKALRAFPVMRVPAGAPEADVFAFYKFGTTRVDMSAEGAPADSAWAKLDFEAISVEEATGFLAQFLLVEFVKEKDCPNPKVSLPVKDLTADRILDLLSFQAGIRCSMKDGKLILSKAP
ncbi:MAG: hypothetical protein AAB074_03990 [Planctomycetota bacterium]